MSGKLVGEVMTAAPVLKSRGLTRTGFVALLAIAEKCHTDTREGSVRWDHIRQVLYGATKRTAQRAVTELRTLTLVEVVSVGFGNRHGARAPVYRLAPVLDDDKAVSQSNSLDDDTAVSPSTFLDDDKNGSSYDKTRSRRDIANSSSSENVSLDGFYMTGSSDGLRAADAGAAAPDVSGDEEPPRYCAKHRPHGTTDKCLGCKGFRLEHERWECEQASRDAESATRLRAAIDACSECDDDGLVDAGLDEHGNEQVRLCPRDHPGEAA